VVDKLLGLYDTDSWKNAQYLDLMSAGNEIWWIKQAKKWFASSDVSSYKGYLKTGLSALILELWYVRFRTMSN